MCSNAVPPSYFVRLYAAELLMWIPFMIFLLQKIRQHRVTVLMANGTAQTLVGNFVHSPNVLIKMRGDWF
jgi:hypothetical protein